MAEFNEKEINQIIHSNDWIQNAVMQKHPNMTLQLASTFPIVISRLDKILGTAQSLPETPRTFNFN